MADAKLICYDLGQEITPVKKTQLHRDLYGYKDVSNHGRYTYRRKGFIDQIKHRKLLNSVLITSKEDSKELIAILKKYGAKVYAFNIKCKL